MSYGLNFCLSYSWFALLWLALLWLALLLFALLLLALLWLAFFIFAGTSRRYSSIVQVHLTIALWDMQDSSG